MSSDNCCVPLFASVPQGSSYREHNFFQYPHAKKLINKRCDTYDAQVFCSNCELSNYQTSKVGILRYKCLGHKKFNN
jgi:hypothetical protein